MQAVIKFEVPEIPQEESRVVYWYGSLDETPREGKYGAYTFKDATMKTLLILGLKSQNITDLLEDHQLSKEVFEIVVEDFITTEGKKIPTVRRIISETKAA